MDQLRRLKSGQAIDDMPQYDFKTHSRLKTRRRVEPAPVIVVEGILLFVEPDLRALLDIKLFVDTDADIRILRRIRRDLLEHRGRTFQSIREQYYKTVRPMHLQFVEPSKRWADIIIPEGGENRVALDLVIGRLQHYLSDHVHPSTQTKKTASPTASHVVAFSGPSELCPRWVGAFVRLSTCSSRAVAF